MSLSKWLEETLDKPIPRGTTVICMDSRDFLELQQKIKELEGERDAFSKTIDNLIEVNGRALANITKLETKLSNIKQTLNRGFFYANMEEGFMKVNDKIQKIREIIDSEKEIRK